MKREKRDLFCCLLLLGLAMLSGCEEVELRLLAMSELKVPDVEREAIYYNGIRQITNFKDRDSITNPYQDSIYRLLVTDYDSLGRKVAEHLGIEYWGSILVYAYNQDGWLVREEEHTCYTNKADVAYWYFPEWRMVLQYYKNIYRMQFKLWKFDAMGKAAYQIDPYSSTEYTYDSLQRLTTEVQVMDSSLYFDRYKYQNFPFKTTTTYVYHALTSLLKFKVTDNYSIEGERLATSSTIFYDDKGLPEEKLSLEGERSYFRISTVTEDLY